jgi:hypothetical protein
VGLFEIILRENGCRSEDWRSRRIEKNGGKNFELDIEIEDGICV